jgi:hypothetical protein
MRLMAKVHELKTTWDRQSFWCPADNSISGWRQFFSVFSLQVSEGIAFSGVEWWIRSRPATEPQHFHFDKDEFLLRETGKVVCPAASMVLYLDGTGGPTIISSRACSDIGRLELAAPRELAIIKPEANKLLWFPGNLSHAVLGADQDGLRTTLVMNWWQAKPRRIRSSPSNLLLPCIALGKLAKIDATVFSGRLFVPRVR